eukprot:TRINITY_DN26430_c0_g1_i1.p1 TRINITY_DN26430_c0_g1~~TRINITY_DN26430_c0_g1_i1.p1  ORF type:complete len:368 (-),score=29.55 TRINITY_DN26430_c0_g1_i1:126-1229(-)
MPSGVAALIVLGAASFCLVLSCGFFCCRRVSYHMEPCCYCCCRWQCVDRRLAQMDFCSRWFETCSECARRCCPRSKTPADSIDVEGLLPDGASPAVSLTPISSSDDVWQSLQNLFHVTDPHNLGVGRDVTDRKQYSSLQIVGAWKIEASIPSARYEVEKGEVRQHARRLCGAAPPMLPTKLDAASRKIALDDTVNEKLLLHGTKPQVLASILHNGLNERFSGGLFGQGLYLAEDPSKIDQYCIPARLQEVPAELQALLRDENSGEITGASSQPVCFALVCRVAVGISIHTKNGEKSMHPPYQPLFTGADKRELSFIPGSSPPVHFHTLVAEAGPASQGFKVLRHREFIAFHAQRVLPEFLITYRRSP